MPFWGGNRKMRKIIENPLGKQCFAEGETRIRETMENVGRQYVLRRRQTCVKIPYKPWGMNITLEAFPEIMTNYIKTHYNYQ